MYISIYNAKRDHNIGILLLDEGGIRGTGNAILQQSGVVFKSSSQKSYSVNDIPDILYEPRN